ncbi:BrnA antitoxin family protein [Acidithiobacillus ferriphilus]|uniref:BrnA antitoxin family protein n=1 Tax=Acidithiobacillus ferriphilus TaxID=1689834 RepID=UPI002DB7AB9E|nr:BrnA antitoxin family protein [Acidithiobacillus ferriphilus]MEB8474368.1 BrnA antitoxin family protein [Acidithiobacillus ferriphilus]
MSENKPNMPSTWVDPDDAPELDAQFFREADLYQGDQLIRRGRGRPKLAGRKVLLSVRYSPEVVTYFRQTGEGWQSRMDAVLREYIQRKA